MARKRKSRQTTKIRKTTKISRKERLLKEREALAQKIDRLREDVKVELEFEADEGDPELPEREKNLYLIATFEAQLKEIDLALEAINYGGRYGVCSQCGKRIHPERLALFPEARQCVPCKEKLERRKRFYPRSAWKR